MKTNDIVYKYILDMIDGNILYCNKLEYCFDEYIRKSKGITFVFPRKIDIIDVHTIPNLPFEIENKLVEILENTTTKYSNQIGDVQVKDYLDVSLAIGILTNNNINQQLILELLKKYNLNIKICKLLADELIEV